MSKIGDRIELTHANRDYLGAISAIGAQPTAVEFSAPGGLRGSVTAGAKPFE
jgi:hypothetical protein